MYVLNVSKLCSDNLKSPNAVHVDDSAHNQTI